jgi:hypothetical protein
MFPADQVLRGRRGAAALELVLIAPIFFLIALATTDVVRYFRAQLRVETVAVQLGQIVSQCRRITDPGDVSQFWAHATRIAGGVVDVNSGTGGAVIVTAVGRNNNANRALWRKRTGNTTIASSVATTVPGTATIAEGFVVPSGQTLFVTEVYAIVQPWILSAGLIGTVLPNVLNGTTLFLSRAPDPTVLQTDPATVTNPNTADCTA